MRIDLGPVNHHAALCMSRIRWLSLQMRIILKKEGIWEDLMQELYSAAFDAWKSGMDDAETRSFAQKRIYSFLKAYGFRLQCGHYLKPEKALDSVYEGIFDRGLAPGDYQPGYFISHKDDHLDEKFLALLRKHPEGLTRGQLSAPFQVPVREASWYLDSMIEKGEVVEVKRENTRGRPFTPLYFIAGGEKPAGTMVRTERDERIRQAYFVEGKSIKRIVREFHHTKRTVHRAIRSITRE
jgi:hypothetical protein